MEYLVEVSKEGKKRKVQEAALQEFWKPKVHIGQRLAHAASGVGGQVYKILNWGVEVWVDNRKGEREHWSWGQFLRRQPRIWKRHPRTGRFPRLVPTKQCHCKAGEIRVVKGGDHAVRCKTCRQLIGSESFPNRFWRAEKLLRAAALAQQARAAIRPRGLRPNQRKTNRRPSAVRKQSAARMGIRPGRPTKARRNPPKKGRT